MKFIYQGPVSSVTLAGGIDVNLHPGCEVDLPKDNAYVRTLLAKGFLTAVAAAPSKKKAVATVQKEAGK